MDKNKNSFQSTNTSQSVYIEKASYNHQILNITITFNLNTNRNKINDNTNVLGTLKALNLNTTFNIPSI